MALTSIRTLSTLTDGQALALRQRWTELGFTDRSVQDAERIAPGQFDAVRLPLVRWTLERKGTPEAALTRVFVYGDDVEAESLEPHLGTPLFSALRQAEMLLPAPTAPSKVRAGFRVLPFQGLWLLHDDPSAGAEAVMGPGPTTLELSQWMSVEPGQSVLDVGCGAGTLALVAAQRGASRVVGTDINERAVRMAAFNARLNHLHAEFRVGSLFEPVAGERFDRVVAQPPYVARPENVASVTYLHGGAMGDELAMALLAGLPQAIAPQGEAQVMFDSAVRKQTLASRVRAALGTAAVDVVLLSARGASADLHALGYATVDAPDLGPLYEACVRRYRAHLEAVGVSEFTHALLALRTSDSPGGTFTVGVPVRSLGGAPPGALRTLFRSFDLASAPDAKLLDSTLALRSGLTWVEERAVPDSSRQPKFRVVFPPGSVGTDHEVAEAAYVLLGAFTTPRPVTEAVSHYAQACGASPEDVRAEVLGFVREALGRGLLEPSLGR
jgi:SAM-dependent methyltransferase